MIEYENLKKLNIPFFNEFFTVFQDVCQRGWFILGNNVDTFEIEFADYIGSKYSVGVANGLEALIIALKVLELPAGSEIIVPSNTYIATILAIVHAGLKPVLVEPDIATYNINPALIEEKINERTSAIIVVHLYGKPCHMDRIVEICFKNELKLIEDCAQSHGAKFNGKTTGTFGDFGCFSFYPTKNLGALGDAGAIVSNSAEYVEKVRYYRNYGSQKKYYNEVVGFNSRLDELQAAFLRIKLQKLDQINAHKRKLASIYHDWLDNRFIKPVMTDECFDVFHIYNIRHLQRDEIKEYLNKNGVETEIHYPLPPHKQKAMKGIIKGAFPVSDEIHATTLSLPISYFHTEEEVIKVCEIMNRYLP